MTQRNFDNDLTTLTQGLINLQSVEHCTNLVGAPAVILHETNVSTFFWWSAEDGFVFGGEC